MLDRARRWMRHNPEIMQPVTIFGMVLAVIVIVTTMIMYAQSAT